MALPGVVRLIGHALPVSFTPTPLVGLGVGGATLRRFAKLTPLPRRDRSGRGNALHFFYPSGFPQTSQTATECLSDSTGSRVGLYSWAT